MLKSRQWWRANAAHYVLLALCVVAVIPDPTAAVLTDWWRTAQPDHEEP